MKPATLLHILQISDSLFPTGAFSFSDGLETAAAANELKNGAAVEVWLTDYIDLVFAPCDGLACAKAMAYFHRDEQEQLRLLDAELTAMKPAAAVRQSSHTLGKRFLLTVGAIYDRARFEGIDEIKNLAVIYGVTAAKMSVGAPDAILAFGYSRLAGLVSAALRLTAVGQQEAQQILTRRLGQLPEVTERILENIEAPLTSFVPLMDIRQMNHPYVYSRLFRS